MEIMQFAIAMEKDGEQYYLAQAEKNRDNALRVVFEGLAADEHRHADLLERMIDDVPFDVESANSLTERDDLFRAIEDYRSAVQDTPAPDQAELYSAAMQKEQQSIDLYAGMLDKAEDEVSRGMFAFLVKEEKRHFDILEGLYRHVNRPNEWVESAEFGIREEY